MDTEEIIALVRSHPAVAEVPTAQPDDHVRAGMLQVRFRDGREAGLALGLLSPATGESREVWLARVDQLLAQHLDPRSADEVNLDEVLPLVRSADYFVAHGDLQTPLWDRLTGFIGMGLAIDTPSQIRLVGADELPEDRGPDSVTRWRQVAATNLTRLVTGPLLRTLPHGPDVLAVVQPEAYESSWFAHPTAMADALDHHQRTTGTPWLVIPATRGDLILVNSMTHSWHPLIDALEAVLPERDSVHPVPHLLVDGVWREYLPPVAPDVVERLRLLRIRAEGRAYEACREALAALDPPTVDHLASFEAAVRDGQVFTWTAISCDLDTTSIPRVDQVGFVLSESTHHMVWFEHLLARLPHLVTVHPGTFPTRWIVSKPSPADLRLIAEMAIDI